MADRFGVGSIDSSSNKNYFQIDARNSLSVVQKVALAVNGASTSNLKIGIGNLSTGWQNTNSTGVWADTGVDLTVAIGNTTDTIIYITDGKQANISEAYNTWYEANKLSSDFTHFNIKIDDEEMTITNYVNSDGDERYRDSSSTYHSILKVTRSANSTTATTHTKDSAIYVKQSTANATLTIQGNSNDVNVPVFQAGYSSTNLVLKHNGSTTLTLKPSSGTTIDLGTTSDYFNTLTLANGTSSIKSSSDIRIKQNIEEKNLDEILNNFKNIKLVKYHNILTNSNDIGFIAQDVKKLFPDAVSIDSFRRSGFGTIDDFHSLHYSYLHTLNIGVTKKLIELVEQQRVEIDELKTKVAALENK